MIDIKRTYFECIIPQRNKRAFYEIIAGKDLFGFIIFRRWGRLGTKGQPRMQQRFEKEVQMLREYERVCNERIKHGYYNFKENKTSLTIKQIRRITPIVQYNANCLQQSK